MTSYKRSSTPSDSRTIIGRQDELLEKTFARLVRENKNAHLTRTINAMANQERGAARIKWIWVDIKRPEPLTPIFSMTPQAVRIWTAQRQSIDTESYCLNLSPVKPERGETAIEVAHRDLLSHLKNRGLLQSVPLFLYPRLCHFPAADGPGKRASRNENWHIDFLGHKSADDAEKLLSSQGYQYICTVTQEGGPTTLVLNVDRIELPILDFPPKHRTWILNAYLETLIEEGLVTFEALAPTIWYRVPDLIIHRGPRVEDPFCVPAERAFLHVRV